MSPAIRIGDAERDRAVSDLGDHFAAGRLDRDEFDERADRAIRARFRTDLDPLFADLPQETPPPPLPLPQGWVGGGPPRPFAGPPPGALWLLPFLLPVLLIAVVAGGILFHAPFLLWGLVWVAVILKISGHKRRHRLSHRAPR